MRKPSGSNFSSKLRPTRSSIIPIVSTHVGIRTDFFVFKIVLIDSQNLSQT